MLGPYDLTKSRIEETIDMVTPGSFVLGRLDANGRFMAEFVGRGDHDVRAELRKHIGRYDTFKFAGALDAREAFENECLQYHTYGGKGVLDNALHPSRPPATDWTCPRCGIYG
jgi:hypothetical protein